MTEAFNGTGPIYMQLIEKIRRLIIRGEWKPGEKLPSVREMAVQYGVNPNTVQRVTMELERMHVVETRRGQGTFVTEDADRLKELRNELKQEYTQTFVRDMVEMGFSAMEIHEGLTECLELPTDSSEGGGRA